jgi:hypothetical protein
MTVIYNGKIDLPKYGLVVNQYVVNAQVCAYDQNIIIVIIAQLFYRGSVSYAF